MVSSFLRTILVLKKLLYRLFLRTDGGGAGFSQMWHFGVVTVLHSGYEISKFGVKRKFEKNYKKKSYECA